MIRQRSARLRWPPQADTNCGAARTTRKGEFLHHEAAFCDFSGAGHGAGTDGLGKDDDRNNGGSPNRPDTNQSQNAPQDNGSGGSWQNGTDTPTQPGAGENRRNGEDTLPGTQAEGRMDRGVLRRGAERTATFRQMLENGYVHDSDGFLNDGENTSW